MDKRIKVLRGWDAVERIDIEKNFNATYILINKDLRSLKVTICKNEMNIFYKNELIHKINIIIHKEIEFQGYFTFQEVIENLEFQLSKIDDKRKDKRIQFDSYISFLKQKSKKDFKINYTSIRVFYTYFYNKITVYDIDDTIYSFENNNFLFIRALNESTFIENNKITVDAKILIKGKNKGNIDTFLCVDAKKLLTKRGVK